jgi:hypothetical protein
MAKTPEEQLGVSLPPEPEPQTTPAEPDTAPEVPAFLEAIPEKFRSSEDPEQAVRALAQSYVELETKRNQDAQERNQLAERLAALEGQATEPQYAEPDYADPQQSEEYLRELYEQDPIQAMDLRMQQHLQAMQAAVTQQQQYAYQQQQPVIEAQMNSQAKMIANAVHDNLAGQYDDYEELYPDIRDFLEKNPDFIPREYAWDVDRFSERAAMAYKIVKADKLGEQSQTLAATQEQTDRALKLGAQTVSGRSAPATELTPEQQRNAEILAAHRTDRWDGFVQQNLVPRTPS